MFRCAPRGAPSMLQSSSVGSPDKVALCNRLGISPKAVTVLRANFRLVAIAAASRYDQSHYIRSLTPVLINSQFTG